MLIPKPVFAVSKIAARGPTRYASDGVRLAREGDECTAVATDGRRVLEVRWRDDETDRNEYPAGKAELLEAVKGFERIVPPELWGEANKLAPKTGVSRKPVLKNTVCREKYAGKETAVEFSATDASAHVATCSGEPAELKFPNYKGIVPEYADSECTHIGFNGKLLAGLLSAMVACGAGSENFQTEDPECFRFVVPHDPTKPMLILGNNGTLRGTGVIMPVHLGACP